MSGDANNTTRPAPEWLPESQARRLRSTVRTLLDALGEMERALDPPGAHDRTALVISDVRENERATLSGLMVALRGDVEALAEDLGVWPVPVSARRQFVAEASYAWTVAAEMGSARLEHVHPANPELLTRVGPRVDRLAREFRTLADLAAHPIADEAGTRELS